MDFFGSGVAAAVGASPFRAGGTGFRDALIGGGNSRVGKDLANGTVMDVSKELRGMIAETDVSPVIDRDGATVKASTSANVFSGLHGPRPVPGHAAGRSRPC